MIQDFVSIDRFIICYWKCYCEIMVVIITYLLLLIWHKLTDEPLDGWWLSSLVDICNIRGPVYPLPVIESPVYSLYEEPQRKSNSSGRSLFYILQVRRWNKWDACIVIAWQASTMWAWALTSHFWREVRSWKRVGDTSSKTSSKHSPL